MKLYIFNPDSDLALADHRDTYIPPLRVRRFAQDLAMLPVWYAQPGSAVLAASAYNADYLQLMKQLFPLQVDLMTQAELPDNPNMQVMPWGWSLSLRKNLLKWSDGKLRLPSIDQINSDRIRSSRTFSRYMAIRLSMSPLDYTTGESLLVERHNMSKVEELYASKTLGSCVFKSLWSSSGRGLYWCRNGVTKAALNWCWREIEQHGGITMEPIYDKVEDFAMEFYSNGKGRVFFTGYSSFHTNEKGAYQSSVLSPDACIEDWICCYVPLHALVLIREQVQRELEMSLGSYYMGPVGVDMMVCKSQGEYPYAIHPCVEINLRMTMGMVARHFYDHYVQPGKEGRFYIQTYPSPAALEETRAKNIRKHPLTVERGKIKSGCLELVPVTPHSYSRAYVIIT